MANPRMSLLEEIRKAAADRDEDFVKAALRKTLQDLIEAEVAAIIGADRHERTGARQRHHHHAQGCCSATDNPDGGAVGPICLGVLGDRLSREAPNLSEVPILCWRTLTLHVCGVLLCRASF